GRPSVIFPTGGLAELVEHGVDGYVCPEKSSAALERALAVYEESPAMVAEHGAGARRSLDRLQRGPSFGEEWIGVDESARGVAERDAASRRSTGVLVLFGTVRLLGQELGNIDVMEALRGAGAEVLFLIRREWTKDTIQAELTRRGLAWTA